MLQACGFARADQSDFSVLGAEQVKIAKGAGDVASCKAVGNVISKPMGISATNTDLQNKTFGLGGNTIFVTVTTGEAVEGVAYKCP